MHAVRQRQPACWTLMAWTAMPSMRLALPLGIASVTRCPTHGNTCEYDTVACDSR